MIVGMVCICLDCSTPKMGPVPGGQPGEIFSHPVQISNLWAGPLWRSLRIVRDCGLCIFFDWSIKTLDAVRQNQIAVVKGQKQWRAQNDNSRSTIDLFFKKNMKVFFSVPECYFLGSLFSIFQTNFGVTFLRKVRWVVFQTCIPFTVRWSSWTNSAVPPTYIVCLPKTQTDNFFVIFDF